MATMRIVAGDPYMHDPTLLDRLGGSQSPSWSSRATATGSSTPSYGAAYAAAFGQGRLEIVRDAGHLPQIEQPSATFALIDDYVRDRGLEIKP